MKNYGKVNDIIQRQKAYLKYKRRVENRQVLYLKRRRIYGK